MTCRFWVLAALVVGSVSAETDCDAAPLSLLQTQFVGIREPQDAGVAFSQVNSTRVSGGGCWNVIESAVICGFDWVTEAATCGTETVVDAVLCGTTALYETATNGAKCGYSWVARWVTDPRCGMQTITDAHRCGRQTITDGGRCGYDTIRDGARCGYSEVKKCGFEGEEIEEVSLAEEASQGRRRRRRRGGVGRAVSRTVRRVTCWVERTAKSCRIAKSCQVPRSCQVAKRCDLGSNQPKSCRYFVRNVAKACEMPKRCKKPKSCDQVASVSDCLRDIWGAIKGFGGDVMDFILDAANTFKKILEFFEDIVAWIGKFFKMLVDALMSAVSSALSFLGDMVRTVKLFVEAISTLFNAVMQIAASLVEFYKGLKGKFWLEAAEASEVVVDSSAAMPLCVPGAWLIWPGKELIKAFVSLGKIFSQGIGKAVGNWNDCKNYFATAFTGYYNQFFQIKIAFFDSPTGNMCLNIFQLIWNAIMAVANALLELFQLLTDCIMGLINAMGFLTAISTMVRKTKEDPSSSIDEVVEAVEVGDADVALAAVGRRRRRRRRRGFNKNSLKTNQGQYANWKYRGCYRDNRNRAMRSRKGTNISPDQCAAFAQQNGHAYFGLQNAANVNRSECFSDNDWNHITKYGARSCGAGGDGWANAVYEAGGPADLDGDGVADTQDAFPTDPTEWADTDKDRVGDNADAFPTDPKESKDKDGDGVGDNSDSTPNGGGYSSATEVVTKPGVAGSAIQEFHAWVDRKLCEAFSKAPVYGDWYFSIGGFFGTYGGWTNYMRVTKCPIFQSPLMDRSGLPVRAASMLYNIGAALFRLIATILMGLLPNTLLIYPGLTVGVGCKYGTFVPPQIMLELWTATHYIKLPGVTLGGSDQARGTDPPFHFMIQGLFDGFSFGTFVVYADYGMTHPILTRDTSNNTFWHRIGIYIKIHLLVQIGIAGCDQIAPAVFAGMQLLNYYWMTPKNHNDCVRDSKHSDRCEGSSITDGVISSARYQFDEETWKSSMYSWGLSPKAGAFYLDLIPFPTNALGKPKFIGPQPKPQPKSKCMLAEEGSAAFGDLLLNRGRPEDAAEGYATAMYEQLGMMDTEEALLGVLGAGGRHPSSALVSMMTSVMGMSEASAVFPYPKGFAMGFTVFYTWCPAYVDYGKRLGFHCSGQVYDVWMMFADFWIHFRPPNRWGNEQGGKMKNGVMGAVNWIGNPGSGESSEIPPTSDWALHETALSGGLGKEFDDWGDDERNGGNAYPTSYTADTPASRCPGAHETCYNGSARRSFMYNRLTNRATTSWR